MNPFFLLIISSLGVFRLSELLCCDKGPGGIFDHTRDIFEEGSFFDDLISCPYCNSFWLSTAWVLYLRAFDYVGNADLPMWIAAIWGGSIVILRSIRERK